MYTEHDDSERLKLRHEAIRPARKGFPREHVFAGRWRELMDARRDSLDRILCDYLAPVRQREASVAASVVTWLGTNIGQALLEDAKRRRVARPAFCCGAGSECIMLTDCYTMRGLLLR